MSADSLTPSVTAEHLHVASFSIDVSLHYERFTTNQEKQLKH